MLPHIKTGKLRGLATTGSIRTPLLPQLPTIAELRFPGFEASAWYGLLAPAGTPAAIVSKLHQQTVRALNDPEVKNKLEASGFIIVGSTPAAFSAYIRAEIEKWTPVIISAGLEPE